MDDLSVPHRCHRRWPWVTLAIIIVVLATAVGYTGLWHVPVLSQVFGTSRPRDLNVHPTAADLASAQSKTPMKLVGDRSSFSMFGNQTFSGTVPVENQLTSAEVTAWIQSVTKQDPDVRDVQVKFVNGGMEISALAKRYVNAPVYVMANVARTGTESVAITIVKGKIGNFPVPQKYLTRASEYVSKVVSDRLAAISGFSMEKLEYTNGARTFKGTYPATVTAASGQWW